jgi:serine/threonine protein kinase
MSLREIRGEDPNYAVVKKLGQGAFGEVYKVHRKSDGKVTCKEFIKTMSSQPGPEWSLIAIPHTRAGI